MHASSSSRVVPHVVVLLIGNIFIYKIQISTRLHRRGLRQSCRVCSVTKEWVGLVCFLKCFKGFLSSVFSKASTGDECINTAGLYNKSTACSRTSSAYYRYNKYMESS